MSTLACGLLCMVSLYKQSMSTSKEKHSLTRKLVVYRNWRQWWCKGTRFWKKENETKILYLAFLFVLFHLHVLNIGFLSHFPFPKTLFPSFLHHHCLQFLYPTNFLVREWFSLLVFPLFLILLLMISANTDKCSQVIVMT